MSSIFNILGYEIDLNKIGAIYPIFNEESFIVIVDGAEVRVSLGELDEDEAAEKRLELIAAWKASKEPKDVSPAAVFTTSKGR